MKTTLGYLVLVVCAGLAQAGNAVSREVKGHGATRQLAVKGALYEAVSQVQGVVVSTGQSESGVVVGNLDVTREEARKSVELEGVSVRAIDTISLTEAEGLVKSYEVLSETRTAEGDYEVTLKVWVYDYTSPLASQKTPLAVADIEIEQTFCTFGNMRFPGVQVSRQFSDSLTGQLNASGKFTLLDRAYAKAFSQEKSLWKSEDADLQEKSKLGNVQGAEYLLAGRIRRAGIALEEKALSATGRLAAEYDGLFVAEFRLFVAATRQIAYTGQYRLHLETADVKKLVEKWEVEEIDYDELKDRLLEKAARLVVEDMLEQTYPVRVAVAEPNRLILDQGAGRVNPGDIYTLVASVQEVRDPQTNELLGQAETSLAKIQIKQVLPRFSYAAVVEGQAEAVRVGQICRFVRPVFKTETEAAEQGRKTQIPQTPTGGVKLPFDR